MSLVLSSTSESPVCVMFLVKSRQTVKTMVSIGLETGIAEEPVVAWQKDEMPGIVRVAIFTFRVTGLRISGL